MAIGPEKIETGEAPVVEGRCRVAIEGVAPIVDAGRFPVKRILGEELAVEADLFADGHDRLAAVLLYRREQEHQWHKVPMLFLGNDRWGARFVPDALGVWFYTLEARIDTFGTWQQDLEHRYQAGEDLDLQRQLGCQWIAAVALRAGADEARLTTWAHRLRDARDDTQILALSREEELAELLAIHFDPRLVSRYDQDLELTVERREALYSAWYELFPRSCCSTAGDHGSLHQCEALLPEIARMGFDVVYLPPIHPIGRTHRKGRNNTITAAGEDPGSPWAIGSGEGGHQAIHPQLGTLGDFRRFCSRAGELGLHVALDMAFQCSPDHPYLREHPAWFRWRPDGSVQFAENPPKKYQDIIPFDFESEDWWGLWQELRDVFRFWADQGVRIFRVDNPHTKPFAFWEWTIRQLHQDYPDIVFLAEAFTRPKIMYRLAKVGFSQSYTYFSWRNTKPELEQYLTELCREPLRDFFRPNFWPNTPDILPEFLQIGGTPAFVIRLVLAATLSASYGIYGPPFELCLDEALPGQEEYLDSEKYQVRSWDWNDPRHLRDLIARINQIRKENPALHTTWNLTFCETDNDRILGALKRSRDGTNLILVMVSLDPFTPQGGSIRLPMKEIGAIPGQPFLVHDLLGGGKEIWHTERNTLTLDPALMPARICRLYPRLRREQDFDYYM